MKWPVWAARSATASRAIAKLRIAKIIIELFHLSETLNGLSKLCAVWKVSLDSAEHCELAIGLNKQKIVIECIIFHNHSQRATHVPDLSDFDLRSIKKKIKWNKGENAYELVLLLSMRSASQMHPIKKMETKPFINVLHKQLALNQEPTKMNVC